jgi:hypothetical protein
MTNNYFLINIQVPINNGMPSDYGFNIPEQNISTSTPTSYGFNQQVPMSLYSPTNVQSDGFASNSFSTQLLSDPLMTNVAMHYGNALANTGKQHIQRFVPITALRYYFAVDTDYVVMKLFLLFFPFTHKVLVLLYLYILLYICIQRSYKSPLKSI